MWPFTQKKVEKAKASNEDDLFSGMSVKKTTTKQTEAKKAIEGFDFIDQKEIDLSNKEEDDSKPIIKAHIIKTNDVVTAPIPQVIQKPVVKIEKAIEATPKDMSEVSEKKEVIIKRPIELNTAPISMPQPTPAKKASIIDNIKEMMESSNEIKTIKATIDSERSMHLQNLIKIIESISNEKREELKIIENIETHKNEIEEMSKVIRGLTASEKYIEADKEEQKRKQMEEQKVKEEINLNNIKDHLKNKEVEKCSILKKLTEFVANTTELSDFEIKVKKEYITNREQEEINCQQEKTAIIQEKVTAVEKHREQLQTKKNDANKKQEEFNAMINMMTESSLQKKKIKEGAIKEISAEIEQLQLVINEKITQKKKYEEDMLQCDQEINIVIAQHSQEKDAITSMHDSNQKEESIINQKDKEIKTEQTSLQNKTDSFINAKKVINDYILALEEISNDLKQYNDNHSKLGNDLEQRIGEERELFSSCYTLSLKLSALKGQLEFKNSELREAEKKINDLNDEISSSTKNIEKQEEKKKLLIESKKYLEAGNINSTIKQISTQKDTKKKELTAQNDKIQEITCKRETIIKDIEDLTKLHQEKERSSQIALLNIYSLRIKLSKLLESELSVFNLNENLVIILRSELSYCEKQISNIETTYGIKLEEDFSKLSDEDKTKLISEIKQQLHEKEAEISELVNKEQFEQADALQKQVDSLNDKLAKLEK